MTERYTHGHEDAVLRSHRWRTAENSAGYLLDLLEPGMTVLDVGCGPGTITADLARIVAPGAVHAIDAGADVITAAAQANRADNLTFTVGDVYDLERGDGTVDVVHAHQVLQHLADPVRALREMRRVRRPHGVVAVRDADFSAMSWWPDLPGLRTWLDIYRAVARANGGEPDAGRHLRQWAVDAGFGDVRFSASTWCFSSDDERRWWGQLWADRTSKTVLARRATELGIADQEALDRCADDWRRWADRPGACFVVPHGEVLARS